VARQWRACLKAPAGGRTRPFASRARLSPYHIASTVYCQREQPALCCSWPRNERPGRGLPSVRLRKQGHFRSWRWCSGSLVFRSKYSAYRAPRLAEGGGYWGHSQAGGRPPHFDQWCDKHQRYGSMLHANDSHEAETGTDRASETGRIERLATAPPCGNAFSSVNSELTALSFVPLC